jgi:hypothetical protein
MFCECDIVGGHNLTASTEVSHKLHMLYLLHIRAAILLMGFFCIMCSS